MRTDAVSTPAFRRLARERVALFPVFAAMFVTTFALHAHAQRGPANPTAPSVASRMVAQTTPASDDIPAERCESCHRAEFVEFAKSPHVSAPNSKGPVTTCSTCHGPGRAHTEAEEAAHGDDAKSAAGATLIFGFKGTPQENAARCLTCHATSKNQANFAHSDHLMHGLSCDACHSTHLVEAADYAAGERPARTETTQARIFNVPAPNVESVWLNDSLLQKPQPALCVRCHADVQAQFTLPTHHRVPEGLMTCTDCHQPHGTQNPAGLRGEGWDACVKCHVEKRGPFVFEHASVQVGGCITCHTPHGSVNRMLLDRREERFLCLECHVTPAAPNTPHSRLSFQTSGDCTRCHVTVHGSNFNEDFLQ